MPNADDDDTEATSAQKKAPIDQWLSGEISTIDVIDRFLAFFGINPNSTKRHEKKDET